MPIKIEVRDGQKFAKVADLTNWKDNPRSTSKEDAERLKEQIKLGEHSTLLIDTDGVVLGGNTRLRAYKEIGKREAKVVVVEFVERKGVIHAIVDGIKADRTFDSVSQARLEYALSHNDLIGAYDDGKLAELLQVTPISLNVFKVSTAIRPVEDVVYDSAGLNLDNRTDDKHAPSNKEIEVENLLGDTVECPRCKFEFMP